MIGTKLGPYEVVEKLGAGGMGVVYRAVDHRLRRSVAIKFLSSKRDVDFNMVARFEREARAASALDHPNICTVYGVGETADGKTYIVMAYSEGETLEQRLLRGPLNLEEAVDVLAQVADGLACAHRAGIVHRDIKPSNVFITTDGRVKILDFGIAKIVGATTFTETDETPGTPAYMAPEQFRGGVIDSRTDVWALGALLHTAVTGNPPFRGANIPELAYAITNTRPAPVADTLPRARDIVRIRDQCLRQDRNARYADATVFGQELRALIGAKPAKWRRAHTLIVLGIGLAALGTAIGLLNWPNPEARILRVLVLPPRVQSEDPNEVAMASSLVQSALINTLATIEGVSAVDPGELESDTATVLEGARVTAADEVVTILLSPMGLEWSATLRRLDGNDGRILWSESFAVSRDDEWALEAALRTYLPGGFERRTRPDAGGTTIDRDDYEEYLRLLRTYQGLDASVPKSELLGRLRQLADRSPGFVEAHLLAGRQALNEFIIDRDPERLAIAAAAGERAREIAPRDTRPLILLADCALRSQDTTRVHDMIRALNQVHPGGTEALVYEARLAETRGDLNRAGELMESVIARRPSRANSRKMLEFEIRVGRTDGARRHLARHLERFPTDLWARSRLANYELAYGRIEAADSLYSALISISPRMPYFTNRGIARMLGGRYADAATDFRRALEISPNAWSSLLNLADTEKLSGNHAQARIHYERVVALLRRAGVAPGWEERLVRAQALAHLGKKLEALHEARAGLDAAPENAEALYQAALVHALADEPEAAVRLGAKAIAKGFEPRWFGLPWFAHLQADWASPASTYSDPGDRRR